jgi:hypothetical protein
MKTLIALVLIIDVYVIIYYRLLVSFYYQKTANVKESALGAMFSLPPYSALPAKEKKYVWRYWAAVAVLLICMASLARLVQFNMGG